MSDLERETVALLQRLLRHDTVNPPGNEQPVQEELEAYFAAAGFETTLVGATPERPNLVARLRGAADGPTLCLLSHVDTVYATPDDWGEHGPWSGDEADGFVWGRGALDMKNQTAAEAVAAVSLAREGWRPARGELIVVSVADEETGGALGAEWICREHPELVRCDYLLNEGAGAVLPYNGERLFGVCVAEKGVFRFRITTRGIAGHASIPKIGDNALLKLAPLITALGQRTPSPEVTPYAQAALDALGGSLTEIAAVDPILAMIVEPQLGVTLAPTVVSASEKINVIPAHAELRIDCRVPPGLGEDAALRALYEVLGAPAESGYEAEFTETTPGNGSPTESPLMDAIVSWIADQEPDARAVRVVLPGFTDSRSFRAAFPECVAYGFFPHRFQTQYESAPLIHGANERIDARDLGVATDFFRHACRELLA